jgi:excisionase family DNA binding protein
MLVTCGCITTAWICSQVSEATNMSTSQNRSDVVVPPTDAIRSRTHLCEAKFSAARETESSRGLELGRGERIRTSDILLPKKPDEIAGAGNGLQVSRFPGDSKGAPSNGSTGPAANSKNFAPILLPEKERGPENRHAGVRHAALLSVADVARRLNVCEATVYKLCARGALEHVRILNAVRILPEALESYLRVP